ncbi:hypothetical protein FRC06_006360, partial [Ceratobasidium sp. 370]
MGRAGREAEDNSAIESRPMFVEPYVGPSSPSQTPSGSRGLVGSPTAARRITYAEDPRHHVSVDSPPADVGSLHPQSPQSPHQTFEIYNHQPFLDNAPRLDDWERPNAGLNPLDSSRGQYDVLMTSPVRQVGFLDINSMQDSSLTLDDRTQSTHLVSPVSPRQQQLVATQLPTVPIPASPFDRPWPRQGKGFMSRFEPVPVKALIIHTVLWGMETVLWATIIHESMQPDGGITLDELNNYVVDHGNLWAAIRLLFSRTFHHKGAKRTHRRRY